VKHLQRSGEDLCEAGQNLPVPLRIEVVKNEEGSPASAAGEDPDLRERPGQNQ